MSRAETDRQINGRFALSVGPSTLPAPAGWTWMKLTDVARLESGHTPSRQHPEYWDGDIPWIGIKDAREHHGVVIFSTAQTVTQAGIDNSAARVLPEGTVCLSRTASVGYVTVMGRPMATSQDFVNWVCSDALDPRFLQFLILAEGEGILRFGKGSTHTTIYFPEVMAFHVCIPPVNEQRRIVAKLEALLARSRRAKEALDAIPALLEQFRQSVLAAAFRGDLTAKWREQRGLRDEGGDLPTGWRATTVGAVSREIQYGYTAKARSDGQGPRMLRITDIQDRQVNWATVPTCEIAPSEEQKYALSPGDIVFSRTGATTGKSCLIQDCPRAVFASYLIRLRAGEEVVPRLLSQYFQTARYWEQITENLAGNAQPGCNASKLAALSLPLPPVEEQDEMVRAIEERFTAIDRLHAVVEEARGSASAIDSALLAKAFRGELVEQDPNDEPASVLLERIRRERMEGDKPTRSRRNKSAAAG